MGSSMTGLEETSTMNFQVKKEWGIPVAVGIVCFGAGVVVGRFLLQRRFRKEIEKGETELEELRNEQLQLDFARVEKDREFNHMIQEAAHVIRELKERGNHFLEQFEVVAPKSREEDDEEVAQSDELSMVSVFVDDEEDEWDYEVELPNRGPDKPYIIHRDEYYDNEREAEGYTQTSITYYKGDGILTDENDVPIYQPETVAGDLIFGHGSKDPSICYVRNERLLAEYEVLLDHGYFQVEVLGADLEDAMPPPDDLRHSVRKFRPD